MEHVLIIISALDIPPALSTARELSSYKTVTFDPCLIDELLESGLANVEYVDFEDCPDFAELHNGSRELALATEREIFAAIEEFLPSVSNFSWLHLNFYYLFIASRWYSALGTFLADRFEARFGAAKPTVFINDNPALFFWPSFVPPMALLEALNEKNISFHAYTYAERADESDVIPLLIDFERDPAASWDLLVHLPTCVHDRQFLEAEIGACGKSVIDLRAKYWDLPIPTAKSIGLTRVASVMPRLSPALQASLETMSARLDLKIDSVLAPHIRCETYRARQMRQLTNLYKGQLITYFLLQDFFAQRKPRKMLLSDHDAGFHGPLLAYAEMENIPLLFVPHSKTTADIQFGRDTVTCLTHPIQGDSIDDALGRRVITHKLAYPEQFSGSSGMPGRLKKIGLLLNTVSLNGVFVTPHAPYMEGVRRISDWCKVHGVELIIRSRPGHTINAMLEAAAGVAADALNAALAVPLHAFAADQDVCLMYDAPTTAALEFLRNSVPILNPVPGALAKYEAVISNTAVIPRGTVEEILFRLDSFVADPINLHAFRAAQFASYVNSFQGAQSLRTLL